jgi:hypothetical protein
MQNFHKNHSPFCPSIYASLDSVVPLLTLIPTNVVIKTIAAFSLQSQMHYGCPMRGVESDFYKYGFHKVNSATGHHSIFQTITDFHATSNQISLHSEKK